MTKRLRRTELLQQLLGTAGLQAAQVLVSAAIGFTIVRHLSKQEYAMFNVFTTGSATLVGWAGIGLTSIYIAFANRTGALRNEIRITTENFQSLDQFTVVVGLAVATFFFLASGMAHEWLGPSYLVGVTVSLCIGLLQHRYRIIESAFKVMLKPLRPLAIGTSFELLRLLLVVGVVFLVLPAMPAWGAELLVCASAITIWSSLQLLRRRYREYPQGQPPQPPAHQTRETYRNLMRPLLFPAYFYHASQFFRGSLIFLVAQTETIADAAALGRLMMLFAILDKVVDLIIIPRLGAILRYEEFLKKLFIALGVVFLMSLFAVASALLAPQLWLWLLGEKYDGLGNALVWAVCAACVERLSGLVLFAQLARGESKSQWWAPVFATSTYLAFVAYFGLASAESATLALLVSAVSNLVAQGFILTLHIRRNLAPTRGK